MFLVHYNQKGGSKFNTDLPLNVLKRGTITYYSINFNHHKNFYDFYSGDMVDTFLGVVYRTFKPLNNSNINVRSILNLLTSRGYQTIKIS